MSELKVKPTVKPKSLVIAAAVINAANEAKLSVDILITSGNDSKHMQGSKHYTNEALDIRTKELDDIQLNQFIDITMRRLGNNYQFVMEDRTGPNEHLHLEYDPQ